MREDVEKALGDHYAGAVPNNYRLVRDAVDRGVILEEIERDNNVTAALTGLVLSGEVDAADNNQKKSLLSFGKNLLKRKAG